MYIFTISYYTIDDDGANNAVVHLYIVCIFINLSNMPKPPTPASATSPMSLHHHVVFVAAFVADNCRCCSAAAGDHHRRHHHHHHHHHKATRCANTRPATHDQVSRVCVNTKYGVCYNTTHYAIHLKDIFRHSRRHPWRILRQNLPLNIMALNKLWLFLERNYNESYSHQLRAKTFEFEAIANVCAIVRTCNSGLAHNV